MIKKIIKKDLKNFFKPTVIIILLAIVIVPSLYSIVNIVAFWDPYSNIDELNVGIVNYDDGNFGEQVVNKLESSKSLNFISTNYKNGYDNLNKGSYYGLIVIPKNFTKDIESINTTTPRHADIQLLINSKTNPVATKILINGGSEIQSQINNEIVSTVNGIIFGELENVSNMAIPKINNAESKMDSINNDLDKYYSEFQILSHITDRISKQLKKNNISGPVVNELNGEINKINNKINNINNQRLLFKEDVSYFNEYYYPMIIKISEYSASGVEDYFNSPVVVNSKDIHPVNFYGNAIAEFYVPLSIFVGALVSVAMFSPRVKGLEVKPLEEYLGKLGLFLMISVLQNIVLTVVLLLIHLQNFNPFLLLLSNIFIGLCFMTFVYSLVSSLGNVGKFVTILLLVFQIGGSGGMYPIEFLPKFFQAIHSILPLSYGVAILRENITAPIWSVLIQNSLILLIFPIIGVILSLIIKPFLQERVKWMEKMIEESELF